MSFFPQCEMEILPCLSSLSSRQCRSPYLEIRHLKLSLLFKYGLPLGGAPCAAPVDVRDLERAQLLPNDSNERARLVPPQPQRPEVVPALVGGELALDVRLALAHPRRHGDSAREIRQRTEAQSQRHIAGRRCGIPSAASRAIRLEQVRNDVIGLGHLRIRVRVDEIRDLHAARSLRELLPKPPASPWRGQNQTVKVEQGARLSHFPAL